MRSARPRPVPGLPAGSRRGHVRLLQAASRGKSATITVAGLGLTIDPDRREARLGDKALSLSRKEFDLLKIFAANPGRVFDRQTLLTRVWGEDAFVEDRTVDVHVRWLREKIEPEPGKPQFLLTVRGVGYKFYQAALPSPRSAE